MMAVGFVMNWDLNTSIPIRWYAAGVNDHASRTPHALQGGVMKPLLDVLMILDALEKEGSLRRRRPNSTRRRPL